MLISILTIILLLTYLAFGIITTGYYLLHKPAEIKTQPVGVRLFYWHGLWFMVLLMLSAALSTPMALVYMVLSGAS